MKKNMAYAISLIVFVCLFNGNVYGQKSAKNFTFGPIEIKMTIENYIKGYYKGKDILVMLNNFPRDVKEGNILHEISFTSIPDDTGRGVCMVKITNTKKRDKTFLVSFRVVEKKLFFVARRNISKGDNINSDDIERKETYSRQDMRYALNTEEEIIGKIAKKHIQAGAIINLHTIEEKIVVQRGEIVAVVAENKGIFVQTKGKALDKGRMNDIIRIRNEQSGRNITGRIIAAGTVKIDI